MGNIFDVLKSWIHRKTAESFTTNAAGKTAVRAVSNINTDGSEVDVQNPFPTNGDSVYVKDLNETYCDNGDFSGDVTDHFDDLKITNIDITGTSPKVIKLWFNRPVYSSELGIGCDDLNYDYSNVKLELLGAGEVVRKTIDNSADNTKYNSSLMQFEPAAFGGVIISFYTTDIVGVSAITIRKEIKTKSQIVGIKPDGTVTDFKSTAAGNFKCSIEEIESGVTLPTSLPSTYFDAFGRLAVATPYKLLEYSATHDIDLIRYHTTSSAGAATITNNSTKTQNELYVTTASGDKAVMQTRRYVHYNKANAQEIFIICKPDTMKAGLTQKFGYFDDNNGIYWEFKDTTDITLNIRSNTSGTPVETVITRDNWDDPLDGTGASGLTADFSKQTVYKVDFGWLSSRGVRFFIDLGGTFVLVKQWYISNTLDVPFMATAQLPIRFEIENTATTASESTFCHSCYAVQSSGSHVQEGQIRSNSSGVNTISVSTTETIVAGIRINPSNINASIKSKNISFLPEDGTEFAYYKVIYNPTLVGDTWATPSEGIYQSLIGATSYTGGSIVASGHFSLGTRTTVGDLAVTDVLSDIYLGSDLVGTTDALIVTIQTTAGTGEVFFDGEFKEFN